MEKMGKLVSEGGDDDGDNIVVVCSVFDAKKSNNFVHLKIYFVFSLIFWIVMRQDMGNSGHRGLKYL